ncbi:hypothetical protein KI387_043124, partial [Taxus chinensis]
ANQISGYYARVWPWYHGVLLHYLSIPRVAYDASLRPPPLVPPSGGEGGDESDDNDE